MAAFKWHLIDRMGDRNAIFVLPSCAGFVYSNEAVFTADDLFWSHWIFYIAGHVRDFLWVRDVSALSAAKRCWSWRAKRWTALTYFSLKVLSCFPFPPKRNGNSFGGFWLIYVMQFSHPLRALIPLDWSRRFRTASLLFIDCALEFVNLYLHPISARGN